MPDKPKGFRFAQRYLDPASRLGEILFGVIMVLTVTLAASLTAAEGREGVRQLLWTAIGCNIAWGIIDGIMYVMGCVTIRSGQARLVHSIQNSPDPTAKRELVREHLEERLNSVTDPEVREALYQSILANVKNVKVRRVSATKEDFLGALACFWLVFFACLPAALPFLIFSSPDIALRVSNALMIAMLFLIGMQWGSYAHTNRLVAALAMAGLGLALVGIAILLGG